MRQRGRTYGPVVVALLIFWGWMAWAAVATFQRSGGFAYTLDDAYIHLAMARNWADHNVWGVTRYAFTSASSAPLWTFLLGLILKLNLPAQRWTPYLLNMGFGTALLVLAHRWWQQATLAEAEDGTLTIGRWSARLPRGWVVAGLELILLIVLIFVVPIGNMVQNGMEHLLHALASVIVVITGARSCIVPSPRNDRLLLISVFLLTAIRYEGFFIVAAVGLWLLWHRRWGLAVGVGLAALLIPTLYGLYAVQNDWPFLPSSLVLKSGDPLDSTAEALWTLAGRYVWVRLTTARVDLVLPIFTLMLVGLVVLSFAPRATVYDRITRLALGMALVTTLLHLMFISHVYALFGRYTAYLVAMLLILVGGWLQHQLAHRPKAFRVRLNPAILPAIALLVLLMVPLVSRAATHVQVQWYSSSNIYEQQVQMGRFFDRYYAAQTVAVNDLGAVTYFADVDCIDLWGLGTLDVLNAKRADTFDTAWMEDYTSTRNLQVAAIYDHWFPAGSSTEPPDSWILVGTLTITDNVVASGTTVTFYATSPAAAATLATNLRQYDAAWPPRTVVNVVAEIGAP